MNNLNIRREGLSLIFNVNGQEISLTDEKELDQIKESISNDIRIIKHYNIYKKVYQDFEEKIDEKVIRCKNFSECGDPEELYYCLDFDYNYFIDSKILSKDIENVFSNIKNDYEKEYGLNHTIIFIPEDWEIHTFNKIEAKQFLLFTYRTYIKPVLDKL
jgi:uncharacterized protein YeeX (DUF496 family)